MSEKKKPFNLSVRINLSKLMPEHYWVNPENNEIHADFRISLYEDDRVQEYKGKTYSDNGFISQQLNEETRKKEKELPNDQKTKTPILGNVKWWKDRANVAGQPGYTGQVTGLSSNAGAGVPGLPGPVALPNDSSISDVLPF